MLMHSSKFGHLSKQCMNLCNMRTCLAVLCKNIWPDKYVVATHKARMTDFLLLCTLLFVPLLSYSVGVGDNICHARHILI